MLLLLVAAAAAPLLQGGAPSSGRMHPNTRSLLDLLALCVQ
jgi:hypothetical protein